MIFKFIKDYLRSLKDKRELKEFDDLVKEAYKKHLKTGKQYVIMPIDKFGDYVLVPASDFLNEYNRTAKKMHIPKMTYPQLLEKAYYKTSNGTLNKRV